MSAMAAQCFGNDTATLANAAAAAAQPNPLFYGASPFGLSQLVAVFDLESTELVQEGTLAGMEEDCL
ncbi:unnamed protein product [Gongylonema pulchrum]|uniref:Uncharacterized protein n=1 Tax=Gongylonema pulchrum TaxID=637853 RepID=A0A3P6QTX5_9BILA|nr:unnamed protein product [Gongylonema pulchrum]